MSSRTSFYPMYTGVILMGTWGSLGAFWMFFKCSCICQRRHLLICFQCLPLNDVRSAIVGRFFSSVLTVHVNVLSDTVGGLDNGVQWHHFILEWLIRSAVGTRAVDIPRGEWSLWFFSGLIETNCCSRIQSSLSCLHFNWASRQCDCIVSLAVFVCQVSGMLSSGDSWSFSGYLLSVFVLWTPAELTSSSYHVKLQSCGTAFPQICFSYLIR